jgi:hypothetical protein
MANDQANNTVNSWSSGLKLADQSFNKIRSRRARTSELYSTPFPAKPLLGTALSFRLSI